MQGASDLLKIIGAAFYIGKIEICILTFLYHEVRDAPIKQACTVALHQLDYTSSNTKVILMVLVRLWQVGCPLMCCEDKRKVW